MGAINEEINRSTEGLKFWDFVHPSLGGVISSRTSGMQRLASGNRACKSVVNLSSSERN